MNQNLAKYIDHTILKPEATKKMIEVLCLQFQRKGNLLHMNRRDIGN